MEAKAYRWTEIAPDRPIALLTRRMVKGESIMAARVLLEKGCQVATHSHPSEQLAMVMSGRVRWTIGAEGDPDRRELEMGGGEAIMLPSNILHAVEALEDTEIIDILSPPGAMGVDSQAH
ncbi:MAG: cupin domain-containing protein [Fimbriimonas ginsengisoli]|uniref:Cupin domain-containing protein n=1 Tax=Fimbriimonas ginsengisoli TaxID=1005039 RepID=A0A931LZ42_FIMGI|nr:cupin domain-containing protein [Fimbriimonas ginsengisoli]